MIQVKRQTRRVPLMGLANLGRKRGDRRGLQGLAAIVRRSPGFRLRGLGSTTCTIDPVTGGRVCTDSAVPGSSTTGTGTNCRQVASGITQCPANPCKTINGARVCYPCDPVVKYTTVCDPPGTPVTTTSQGPIPVNITVTQVPATTPATIATLPPLPNGTIAGASSITDWFSGSTYGLPNTLLALGGVGLVAVLMSRR